MEELIKSNVASSKKRLILVFRSDIDTLASATFVCETLLTIDGIQTASVDLEDWENVLRLACNPLISTHTIEKTIRNLGFKCSELE